MKKLLALVFFIVCYSSYGQNYQVHSVYMYSFTRYIQWPDEYNTGDFEISILGDSPITEELRKLAAAKKVGERSIKVTRLASANEIKKCNILFVPADKSTLLTEILGKVGTRSTLIVTEQPGLGVKGSAVNFISKDGKLAFELNQAALTKQRLKASNELTRLAIII